MECENGVTRSIIDELHSLDIKGEQMEGQRMMLLEVSSMILNPVHGMCKEIKWKMRVVSLELSLMNFVLQI